LRLAGALLILIRKLNTFCWQLRAASISLQLTKYLHRRLCRFERHKNMIMVRARHDVTADAGMT
jgi:hypothetical protein